MPAVEFASFLASDALLADPLLLNDVLDPVSKAEGFISAFSGLQEDEKISYIAITWESLDHHKRFTNKPEYPAVMANLKPAVAGPVKSDHIEFNTDHNVAFTAPVTELIFSKLREGASKEEYEGVSLRLLEGLGSTPGARTPAVFGESKEESGSFYTAVGWDGQEARKNAPRGEETMVAVRKLNSLVTVNLVHVKFTKVF